MEREPPEDLNGGCFLEIRVHVSRRSWIIDISKGKQNNTQCI